MCGPRGTGHAPSTIWARLLVEPNWPRSRRLRSSGWRRTRRYLDFDVTAPPGSEPLPITSTRRTHCARRIGSWGSSQPPRASMCFAIWCWRGSQSPPARLVPDEHSGRSVSNPRVKPAHTTAPGCTLGASSATFSLEEALENSAGASLRDLAPPVTGARPPFRNRPAPAASAAAELSASGGYVARCRSSSATCCDRFAGSGGANSAIPDGS